MGPCQSNSNVIENPINSPEEPNNQFKPFEFDRTVISEVQPKPIKLETNTKGDQLIPQGTSKEEGKYLEYDETLRQLQGQEFKDNAFPAQRSSISKDVKYKANKDITWKKPSEFLKQGKIVLFDNIEPMDIKQGELGDCYFLSSLSALAEIPEQIQKLFITKEYQQNGLYGIYMCHNGIFKQIALDDYIPCHIQGGPIFSKTNGNELWVILLEKAYAKLYSSYHKIESGLSSCALKDLTGAPSEYYIRKGETLNDADLCWTFLKKFVPLNYIITASSEVSNQGVEYQNDRGIVSQHCYAILDIQDVKGSDSIQDRIIQIRNPWGRKEWTGDWSDHSNKWTQELRNRLKVVKQDDGLFWINVKDFITEFSQVCVCKFLPSYKYSAIELTQNNSDSITTKVILMRVFQKTHGFVSIVQRDKRHFDKHAYSLARIIIGIIDPATNKVLNYQGSAMDNERDVCVESTFEPGDYAVYIEVDWNQNYDRYLALSFYGQNGVRFNEMSVQTQQKGNILEGLLRVHEKFTEEEKVKDYGRNMKRISGIVAGYLYFWYQNQNPKDTFKDEVTMSNIKYLAICPPYVDSSKFSVEVKPYDNVFIKYRVAKEGNGGFGYTLSAQKQIIENTSDEEIIQLALTKPLQKHQRQHNGQLIEVYQYIVAYNGGFGFVYQNNTHMNYKETLQLKTENLRGVGVDITQSISIQVGPGKTFLINLKSVDPTKGYSQEILQYNHQLGN